MSNISFLQQSAKVLHIGVYDENELEMICHFTSALDKSDLIEYLNNTTISLHNNGLELYIEVIDLLIEIFVEKEQYEKCIRLKIKKDESIKLIN